MESPNRILGLGHEARRMPTGPSARTVSGRKKWLPGGLFSGAAPQGARVARWPPAKPQAAAPGRDTVTLSDGRTSLRGWWWWFASRSRRCSHGQLNMVVGVVGGIRDWEGGGQSLLSRPSHGPGLIACARCAGENHQGGRLASLHNQIFNHQSSMGRSVVQSSHRVSDDGP